MATVTTNDQHYTDIAAAIREKNGGQTQYLPSQMAAAIAALETGGTGLAVTSGTFTYAEKAMATIDTGLSDVAYFIIYSQYHEETHYSGIEMLTYDSSANRSWASVKTNASYAYRTYISDAFKKEGGVVTIGSTRNGAYKLQQTASHKWIALGS